MKMLLKPLFLTSLIMGIILTISAYSWLGMWLGLEINMMSMITLMSNNSNKLSNESSIKYFIIQAMSSMMLIMAMALSMSTSTHKMMIFIMNSAIFMKIAMAPFHFWFPPIMMGLSWNTAFMMMTIQKIAPMMIMSFITQTSLTIIIVMVNSIMSSISGTYQSLTMKMMAFSSMNHSSWLMAGIMLNMSMFYLYFIMYSAMTWILISILKLNSFTNISQIFYKKMKMSYKLLMFMSLMNMMGIPPMLGFAPKWMMMNMIIENKLTIMMMIMLVSSIISMIFYMNISLSILMKNSQLAINDNSNSNINIMVMYSMCLLLMMMFM